MQITTDLLKQNVPQRLKTNITDSLVQQINDLVEDEMERENFKENLLTYTNVLKDGQYSIQQYLDAVHWCTHRLLGSGVTQAYSKTFPDRYAKLVARGATQKQISSFSTAYRKNKLVNAIMNQTMIPAHIYNADTHQDAINKLASVMADEEVSSRVQVDAAIGLLTHLKQPEVAKVEVEMKADNGSIAELTRISAELAQNTLAALNSGAMTTTQVAQQSIVKVINPMDDDDL